MKASGGLRHPPKLRKSSPYCESQNVFQRYLLPMKSLSELVLYSSGQAMQGTSSSAEKTKGSLGWALPSALASTQPHVSEDAGCTVLLVICRSAPFKLPYLCSKAQPSWAPGLCASLWICCWFLSGGFIVEALTNN